jgi:hypothetical protein
MKLHHDETSLVLAGAWNPAILTPPWVLQHGLGKKLDGTNTYQTFLPTGFGLIFEAPRYVLEELTYSVRPDSLILVPKSESTENLISVEDVAARLLTQLNHTPIGGIGHNFEFREQNPKPAQLDIFSHSRQDLADNMLDGWESTTAVIIASFTNVEKTAVISVQRVFEGNSIVIKINFHHPVTDVAQAISVLKGEMGYSRMSQNLEFARVLLTKLYGDLDNE